MVDYPVGGRRYTQWQQLDAIDGVIHWNSRGFAGGSSPGTTHKQLRQNLYFYDGLSDVIIWQSGNATGGATTHKRLYHNWYWQDGRYPDVIIWQSKGSGGAVVPPPAQTHKRPFHNWQLYDGLSDVVVWQSAGSGGAFVDVIPGVYSLLSHWMGGAAGFFPGINPPPGGTTHRPGFPPVPEFMPDDREHRRQIARAVNTLRQGKQNVTHDVTLTANVTTTVLTDARIGITSAVVPAMPLTADGAAALVAGIWVTDIKTGSCTINHASSAQTDRTIRFVIIG